MVMQTIDEVTLDEENKLLVVTPGSNNAAATDKAGPEDNSQTEAKSSSGL